ncbi:hypothetical protein [Salinispora mooreana]|uniref:hypothetical protein n=2 Tax=Salinispora mooreana TaxID=999545 RepID=UPI0013A57E5E|nr:hypothetical protein [Salinispora mooreana]
MRAMCRHVCPTELCHTDAAALVVFAERVPTNLTSYTARAPGSTAGFACNADVLPGQY